MKNLIKIMMQFFYGRHPYATIISWNWLYTRKIINWYKSNLSIFKNKQVVDYGAGTTPYYELLRNTIKKYIALDFYDNNTESGKIKKMMLGKDGSIPESLIGKAEVILSNQVIMEVENLNNYFSNVAKLSKKGTKLFLTSPFMQTLGPNDNFRVSPLYVKKILIKNGFKILKYSVAGYFFVGTGLSFNMASVLKNKYTFDENAAISVPKMIILAPVFFLINILSLGLDNLFPFYRSPSNFLIIAERQ